MEWELPVTVLLHSILMPIMVLIPVIFFPEQSGMTEQMLWEAIVVPVGYRLGMLVPNGISVMNISWNLPNGSINCRCVDLMASLCVTIKCI